MHDKLIPSGGSSSTKRLAGIELMRGVAAFGVICLHAGLVVGNRRTHTAELLQTLCFFAVPFFLMTSFFFAIRSEIIRRLPWNAWWKNHLARLLVPFIAWSLIYLGLRVAKFYLEHQGGRARELLQDPVSLLLSGGSSMALYFLPILFTGLVLIRLLRSFLCHAPAWLVVVALLIAEPCHELVVHTGNGYSNGWAFTVLLPRFDSIPVLRLVLAIVAHAIRCAPLVFAAALAVRYLPLPRGGRAWPSLVAGAFLFLESAFVTLKMGFFPELTWGVGIFLLAWGVSGFLAPNKWITRVGAFSFGIYLSHQVVLEGMQLAVRRLFLHDAPLVGVAGILGIAATAFALSMIIVGLAGLGGPWLRRVFGLR